MKEIKKGDNVTRKSYNNDIIFEVTRIIKTSNNLKIAILKGIDIRIEADAVIDDLNLIKKKSEKEFKKNLRREAFYNSNEERFKKIISEGKILHLDGDFLYENVP